MDKISYIDGYVERCEDVLIKKEINEAESLSQEIIGIFSSEIDDITHKLDAYQWHRGRPADYIGDIRLLKQKLINYKLNLQSEKEKLEYNLEIAKLNQPNITAHAESNQTQNQNQSQKTNVDIDITVEKVIKRIEEIDDESLCTEDKETLKEYVYSLEGVKASKNKSLFWDKTKDVLKFLADKGADAAIAMLPFIIEGLSV